MRALPVAYAVSLLCWWALEVTLQVRDLVRGRRQRRRDRGSRLAVVAALGASFLLAVLIADRVPAAATPAPVGFAVAGLVLLWAGLAVRIWAVVTLGRSFSTFITVESEQAVVRSGPYRRVRHPSYSGLLLVALGFGLGAGNWLSLLVCALLPVVGLAVRIRVEEAELVRVIGEPYRAYQRDTRRLVPGVW